MTALERYLQKKFQFDATYYLRGGVWSTLGQVVGIIGGISVSSLFTYILTENEYGTYRYLIGLALTITSFSLTGIGQSILQAAARRYYQFYIVSIRTIFVYSIGITATSAIGALYYFYNANISLALGCLLIAVLQPIIITYNNVPSFLKGSNRFKEATILHIFKTGVITFVSVTTVLLTQNVLLLFIAYLFTHATTNIAAHYYYKPKKTKIELNTISQKYLAYAKNSSVRNTLANIAYSLDVIIVFHKLGAEELAIYTIGNIIPEQIKGALKNIYTLILVKFSSYDPSSIKENMTKKIYILGILLLTITIVYITIAPFLYSILFPAYTESVFLSQLLALSFLASLSTLPVSSMKSQMLEKKLYSLSILTSIIHIILIYSAIAFYGLFGLIIARIVSRYIHTAGAFILMYSGNNFYKNKN